MSDTKSAMATIATSLLNNIILERHLIKNISENRKYPLKAIKKLTGYNFYSFRRYVNTELFTIHRKNIEITDDTQLLSKKSKVYCECLIKKFVYPSKYENNEYIYYVGKFYDNSYFTAEEKSFIDLMYDKLMCTISYNLTQTTITYQDLLKFNSVNSKGFYGVVRNVYNAIIQKKLHAGDNIMSYISKVPMSKNEIIETLESSYKFDYFFDKNAILQCDLDNNLNVFIKNFLNLIIYYINDMVVKIELLTKLNCLYPIYK